MLSKCLILLIGYFAASSNAGTVPWIKPCQATDSECILKSAKYALPFFVEGDSELGLPDIEPMHVKDSEVISGDLKMIFKDVIIHQLSQCEIEALTLDHVKSMVSITTNCPIVINGAYYMNGSLAKIAIYGNGEFSIEGGRFRATSDMKVKTITKDSKKHYKVGSFNYKFEPISKYNINFTNLYDGDKDKATPVLETMNGAWKEIIITFGKGIMKECMTSIANAIDTFLKVVPAEELEIE